MGCHSLLQVIFPTRGLNLGLLPCRQNLYPLSHQGIIPSLFQYRGPMDRCACSVMAGSVTPWTVARQAPLSMEFSRQEYWSGLLFPSPQSFLTQGFLSLTSPALAGGFFTTSTTWEAQHRRWTCFIMILALVFSISVPMLMYLLSHVLLPFRSEN